MQDVYFDCRRAFPAHGGQLFEYSNGAWAPATRGLTSVALEFALKALRRAQAYFGVMAKDEGR